MDCGIRRHDTGFVDYVAVIVEKEQRTLLHRATHLAVAVKITACLRGRRPKPSELDIIADICKSSSRYADHSGMVLNGVFLGVWVTEEAARGVHVVEELDDRIGDAKLWRSGSKRSGWRH